MLTLHLDTYEMLSVVRYKQRIVKVRVCASITNRVLSNHEEELTLKVGRVDKFNLKFYVWQRLGERNG